MTSGHGYGILVLWTAIKNVKQVVIMVFTSHKGCPIVYFIFGPFRSDAPPGTWTVPNLKLWFRAFYKKEPTHSQQFTAQNNQRIRLIRITSN